MRPCDIEFDKPAGPWVYRPEQHKNAFRERERIIYMGPKAQQIIKEFLADRATIRLSRAFSFSSSLNCLAWSVRRPPYSLRQRK